MAAALIAVCEWRARKTRWRLALRHRSCNCAKLQCTVQLKLGGRLNNRKGGGPTLIAHLRCRHFYFFAKMRYTQTLLKKVWSTVVFRELKLRQFEPRARWFRRYFESVVAKIREPFRKKRKNKWKVCATKYINWSKNSNGYINPANTNWFVNIKCLIASKTVKICNLKKRENNKVNQVPIQQAKQLIISLEK